MSEDTKCLSLISDYEELNFFFNETVPTLQPGEVYFISLSARVKCLTAEQKAQLQLGRTEMFERRIIRETSWGKFIRTIHKFEAAEGAYTSKIGEPIPANCITVYWNVNPSSTLKAWAEFNRTMTDYLRELSTCAVEGRKTNNIMDRINKMDRLLLNCYQKNRGTKRYIDVDFDVPKPEGYKYVERFTGVLAKQDVTYYVIDTHSGYHVLLDRSTVGFNFPEELRWINDDAVYEFGSDGVEVVVNKNEMIPVPGTYQCGYPVRILNKP